MTVEEFIDTAEKTMSTGKVRLMPEQRAVYHQKLNRFTEEQISAIYDKVLEITAHFPKVKDCYDAARDLGYFADDTAPRAKPHTWEPTECRFCAGSGLIAALYEQEFEFTESGACQTLKLNHIGPYHKSADRYAAHPNDVRAVYRCQCPAGEVETIQHGLPRWSDERPVVLKRPWG